MFSYVLFICFSLSLVNLFVCVYIFVCVCVCECVNIYIYICIYIFIYLSRPVLSAQQARETGWAGNCRIRAAVCSLGCCWVCVCMCMCMCLCVSVCSRVCMLFTLHEFWTRLTSIHLVFLMVFFFSDELRLHSLTFTSWLLTTALWSMRVICDLLLHYSMSWQHELCFDRAS